MGTVKITQFANYLIEQLVQFEKDTSHLVEEDNDISKKSVASEAIKAYAISKGLDVQQLWEEWSKDRRTMQENNNGGGKSE